MLKPVFFSLKKRLNGKTFFFAWKFKQICGGSKIFRNQKILYPSFPYTLKPKSPKVQKIFVKNVIFYTPLVSLYVWLSQGNNAHSRILQNEATFCATETPLSF